jgi:hypothetical protein
MCPSLPRHGRGWLIAPQVDGSDVRRERNQRERTPCRVAQLVGDTAEEEILNGAVKSSADHDEVCVLGVGDIQDSGCRMPFDDDDPMLDVRPGEIRGLVCQISSNSRLGGLSRGRSNLSARNAHCRTVSKVSISISPNR